jgi:hypothetical protein
MSTLVVVEEILREANQPLSVREIVERAGAALPTRSKTPDTVVARDLSMDIKRKAEVSLFIRTSPGRYTLRAMVAANRDDASTATNLAPSMAATATAQPTAPTLMSQALGTERAGTRPAAAPAPVKATTISA